MSLFAPHQPISNRILLIPVACLTAGRLFDITFMWQHLFNYPGELVNAVTLIGFGVWISIAADPSAPAMRGLLSIIPQTLTWGILYVVLGCLCLTSLVRRPRILHAGLLLSTFCAWLFIGIFTFGQRGPGAIAYFGLALHTAGIYLHIRRSFT